MYSNKEKMPDWLKKYKIGDKINFSEVFKHRILYYPGAEYDTNPIIVFNTIGMLHTYVLADYLLQKNKIIKAFENEYIKDYKLLDCKEISISDLKLKACIQHYQLTQEEKLRMPTDTVSYGLIAIFERVNDFDNLPDRFAVIYLGADGICTYDMLFQNYKAPYVLALQDHGFGCNYSYFGFDSPMHIIAKKINKLPNYIFCAENTYNWDGYELLYDKYQLPNNNRDRYLSIKK